MKNFQGFELNSNETDPYVIGIGKYLINFGAVEMLTFPIIEELANDDVIVDLSMGMQLSKRLELIVKLTKARKIEGQLKEDILKIVDCARMLSTFRNDIAHNPVILGKSAQSDGTVAYVGIPKVKKSYGNSKVTVIDIKAIESGIDAVNELAQNLNEVLDLLKESECVT